MLPIIILTLISQVLGHGYMLYPINRASLWRLEPANMDIPHNYGDNAYYCGGFAVQHYLNDGKCGPCGDSWSDPIPRSNENGGTYGNGVVVESFASGSIIETEIRITANHLGKISYQLCHLDDPTLPETEDCFQELSLANGALFQEIFAEDYDVNSTVQLPEDFYCERCVLRWHYTAGNNWGDCGNGTSQLGCGPQETFRSCADISILPQELYTTEV